MSLDHGAVGECAQQNDKKACVSFPRHPTRQPEGGARNNSEIKTRDYDEVIESAGLKLPFDLRREAVGPAQNHSHHQTLNDLIAGEGFFETSLNPFLDPIRSVPPSLQHSNEAWVPDRARPVDPLQLQVTAKIK